VTALMCFCELNRPGFPGDCFICELRLPDRKRKLTAVCSHDASIGNVGAPLSIFVEPEETDQIV
ncbi:hypothetical protein, partial [Escherichia coli]|uniref:hypothetical protein n=1 Tax=Escherichia coli TaxID=562 RepID=UPI0030075860